MAYVENDGVRIHYEVEGNGPPLLLHHGFTISLEEWRQFGYVDALKAQYQVILIDARGHGQSDKPHDPGAYGMARRASDVIAVLDDLNVDQVNYLGYSMGGRIGFDTAKLAPARLRSLMIGGAHPYATTAHPERLEWATEGLEPFLERQPLPEHVKTLAFRARMLSNDVEAFIAEGIARPNVEDVLPSLTMPCLLYAGEVDGAYPRVKQCASLIPDATFVSLPGLDHWAGIYRSDMVLPHIRAFLEHVTR